MDRCRIAVVSDLLLEDGSFAFPDYTLGSIESDVRIEVVRLPSGGKTALALREFDALISVPMGVPITAEVLPRGGRLTAIMRVGVGYEDVDVAACTAHDVALVIPVEVVRRPTAVAALTLILALANRLLDKHRVSQSGPRQWDRRAELRGMGLAGRTLGLVGCGSIGSDLITIAEPLDLNVLIADPGLTEEDAHRMGCRLVALDDLMAAADFVSIHCPLEASTRHLIDARRLGLMKTSAFLVNTARGGIVDQRALSSALAARRIAGAGLDVFEQEPPSADDPLLALDNVVLSAHALNWTRDLDRDLGLANARAILELIEGRTPDRIVNREVLTRPGFLAKWRQLQNRVG